MTWVGHYINQLMQLESTQEAWWRRTPNSEEILVVSIIKLIRKRSSLIPPALDSDHYTQCNAKFSNHDNIRQIQSIP